MKETTAINGSEGTVSKKTQVSLNLLEQGNAPAEQQHNNN